MANFNYFSHTECEYYALCHGGIQKNCLFCFCPLYNYDCLGAPKYTKEGIKDCSDCLFPHKKENYGLIIEFLKKRLPQKPD